VLLVAVLQCEGGRGGGDSSTAARERRGDAGLRGGEAEAVMGDRSDLGTVPSFFFLAFPCLSSPHFFFSGLSFIFLISSSFFINLVAGVRGLLAVMGDRSEMVEVGAT
jgi:hypothetical protein